ncbi:MAG: DGQHR domain-containing protein [Oscillospiraceae bacterium]|nr:DGQHR domain-containing protein [Oscillospiraceae bacterium]
MTDEMQLIIQNIIEVEQPIGTFLIAKVRASDLLDISFKEERYYNKELEDYIGIQRPIKKDKIKSLERFISTKDATFPNTIIGTLNYDTYDYNRSEKTLKIKRNKDAFKIIDGQHRLMAFENMPTIASSFDLVVAFFLDVPLSDQAYIFSIINTTQTKLDPSLMQDLSAISDITTPEKIVRSIAQLFNKRHDSPWQRKIKMLGKKDELSNDAIISQYSFNKSILEYMYDNKDVAEIRNILKDYKNDRSKLNSININKSNFIFWDLYISSDEGIIYIMLNSYFSVLKKCFPEQWGNKASILCKTSGYAAFMKLFKDFYTIAKGETEKLTNTDFYENFILEKIVNKVDIENEEYRLGASGANTLYKKLKELFNS